MLITTKVNGCEYNGKTETMEEYCKRTGSPGPKQVEFTPEIMAKAIELNDGKPLNEPKPQISTNEKLEKAKYIVDNADKFSAEQVEKAKNYLLSDF